MNKEPRVSVIMPVYNAKEYVGNTVRSVLEQKFHDFELIIIDDGSSDGSTEICEQFARNDTRIRFYRQKNHGICYSRNHAMEMARGEYIAFCDHDDIYEPEYLMYLVGAAENNQVDLVKGKYKGIIENDGYQVNNTTMDYLDGVFTLDRLLSDYTYFLRTINVIWNGLYVRKIIKENDIKFNESFKAGWEDNLFNLEYLKRTRKICGVNKLIYSHIRRTGQSASLGYNANRTEDLMIVYKAETEFLKEHKDSITGRTFIDHQNRFIAALKTELWYKDSPLTNKEKRKKLYTFMKERCDFEQVSIWEFISALNVKPKVTIKWLMFHLNLSRLLCLYWNIAGD